MVSYLHKTPSLLPDTFPLGTDTQRCDCCSESLLKHYTRNEWRPAFIRGCCEHHWNSINVGWILKKTFYKKKHYFSKSAENTHKIFFLLKTIYTYTEVFQGHSEQLMAQDGTVWIICTWNMQTITLPSCTVKWWVSEHVLSHLIASAFKRWQHLICSTVRRALISRQTSTVFLESHHVCFVQMYQQRFIRVHKWTLVCLLVSLFLYVHVWVFLHHCLYKYLS